MIFRTKYADICTDKRIRLTLVYYCTDKKELSILKRYLRMKYKAFNIYLTYDTLL